MLNKNLTDNNNDYTYNIENKENYIKMKKNRWRRVNNVEYNKEGINNSRINEPYVVLEWQRLLKCPISVTDEERQILRKGATHIRGVFNGNKWSDQLQKECNDSIISWSRHEISEAKDKMPKLLKNRNKSEDKEMK